MIFTEIKKSNIFFLIFLIILIFTLISFVSASDDLKSVDNSDYLINDTDLSKNTLNSIDKNKSQLNSDLMYKSSSNSSNHYNVYSNSTNDEIQTIFDMSADGDTIEFVDANYSNISIVVDKQLNIISNRNSIINSGISKKAQDMGIFYSFAFHFTSLSSNSLIKGLRFMGDSDYLIDVLGANNISIINNSFDGGAKSAIRINDSMRNSIINNSIKNSFDGIVFNKVNRSLISQNKIYSNKNNGLTLENVSINNLTNNRIYRNGGDGILLANAKTNRIYYNNITDNRISGLRLEGFTIRNQIKYNNISSNVMNIYANSLTTGDVISYNSLMYAKRSNDWFYTTGDNLGSAIVFADNYEAAKADTMFFGFNSVGFNAIWDAKSTMSHPDVEIAPNWYFDNDGNYGLGHICPMVFGTALDPEEFKHLSMGFSTDGKGIIGQLLNGESSAGAGGFTIDNININGKDYGSVEVSTDGNFKIDSESVPAGSNITITVNGHSFTINTDKDLKTEKSSNDSYVEDSNYKKPKQSNEGFNEEIVGNGTGSGTGASEGTGSGEGNFTGSGISVGTLSGESNSGNGDSGENGGGSASEGGITAYEIQKQMSSTAAKNSQLIAVFAVFAVILVIALGYKSKKEDNFDDYEL